VSCRGSPEDFLQGIYNKKITEKTINIIKNIKLEENLEKAILNIKYYMYGRKFCAIL
jgi:hypothetical protein